MLSFKAIHVRKRKQELEQSNVDLIGESIVSHVPAKLLIINTLLLYLTVLQWLQSQQVKQSAGQWSIKIVVGHVTDAIGEKTGYKII